MKVEIITECCNTFDPLLSGLGAKSQILSSVAKEEKLNYYFQSGTCHRALETHVLVSFL